MKSFVLCAVFFCAHVTSALAADPSPACLAKSARIESQISEAAARGNSQEVAGLKKALRGNKAHCTDKSLAGEREKDINQAKRKVAAREKSLAEAERKGDAKKIADRTAKLDKARSELAQAEKPLL